MRVIAGAGACGVRTSSNATHSASQASRVNLQRAVAAVGEIAEREIADCRRASQLRARRAAAFVSERSKPGDVTLPPANSIAARRAPPARRQIVDPAIVAVAAEHDDVVGVRDAGLQEARARGGIAAPGIEIPRQAERADALAGVRTKRRVAGAACPAAAGASAPAPRSARPSTTCCATTCQVWPRCLDCANVSASHRFLRRAEQGAVRIVQRCAAKFGRERCSHRRRLQRSAAAACCDSRAGGRGRCSACRAARCARDRPSRGCDRCARRVLPGRRIGIQSKYALVAAATRSAHAPSNSG